jgi:hypothetical protein
MRFNAIGRGKAPTTKRKMKTRYKLIGKCIFSSLMFHQWNLLLKLGKVIACAIDEFVDWPWLFVALSGSAKGKLKSNMIVFHAIICPFVVYCLLSLIIPSLYCGFKFPTVFRTLLYLTDATEIEFQMNSILKGRKVRDQVECSQSIDLFQGCFEDCWENPWLVSLKSEQFLDAFFFY